MKKHIQFYLFSLRYNENHAIATQDFSMSIYESVSFQFPLFDSVVYEMGGEKEK